MRILDLAGVYTGPQEELLQKDLHQLASEGDQVLARAADANPEGFWEHYRIMRLNERILKLFGGNWREPPELPDGWERSRELAGERDEALALVADSFGERAVWGWKDPRNSLTLPFWRQLIPSMRFVVCLRNPVDVAASLQRRDGLSFEQGVDLWKAYVSAALRHTSSEIRLLVPYESYFSDLMGTAEGLTAAVGLGGAFAAEERRRRLENAVDDGLWRHRTSTDSVISDPRLRPDAISLFRSVESLVDGQS